MRPFPSFNAAILEAGKLLIHRGYAVHTERWQGLAIKDKPDLAMTEILNFDLCVPMPGEDLDDYRRDIEPNLPWADDHFLERVKGEPLNPGEQWKHWPWGHSANNFRTEGEQFNHTYMERYWPRYAGYTEGGLLRGKEYPDNPERRGIRERYGDLLDVVLQLKNEPLTRQAYFPVFFPEDTGGAKGGRVPCSLGYHFIMRGDRLHVNYYIRSCDYYRHFRDDIYLTARLLLWVLDRLRKHDPTWNSIQPGMFSMTITSLHIFVNDRRLLVEQLKG